MVVHDLDEREVLFREAVLQLQRLHEGHVHAQLAHLALQPCFLSGVGRNGGEPLSLLLLCFDGDHEETRICVWQPAQQLRDGGFQASQGGGYAKHDMRRFANMGWEERYIKPEGLFTVLEVDIVCIIGKVDQLRWREKGLVDIGE